MILKFIIKILIVTCFIASNILEDINFTFYGNLVLFKTRSQITIKNLSA